MHLSSPLAALLQEFPKEDSLTRFTPETRVAARVFARAHGLSEETAALYEAFEKEHAPSLNVDWPENTSASRAEMSQPHVRRAFALRYHAVQHALWTSQARFCVVPAGRRSGKTELGKRKIAYCAMNEHEYPDAWYICAAPTRDQAKRIFWRDMKALIPRSQRDGFPRESDLTIKLINGAEITVMGMEEPARVEGTPVRGALLDEYANMKERVLTDHLRPALADRNGWAWFTGVPEGRNHYHSLYNFACEDRSGEWAAFTWFSSDILPPHEIASAKRMLDPLTFQQEYEASFVNFTGRAYYLFERSKHARVPLQYDPKLPLIFCFDFNVSPGVAVVCQEQYYKGSREGALSSVDLNKPITCVIGEVWIPQDSNTPAVCRKLISMYPKHSSGVRIYGDASGGQRGTAKIAGSDWALVKEEMRAAYGSANVSFRVPDANPKERSRVNALNSRVQTMDGTIRLLVDAIKAPHVVTDLEGVRLLEGGSGEIDLAIEKEGLNHISSALGYYAVREFPTEGMSVVRRADV